jgi:hypothetical protein
VRRARRADLTFVEVILQDESADHHDDAGKCSERTKREASALPSITQCLHACGFPGVGQLRFLRSPP